MTGYKGRIGIYEMLYLDDSIRNAVREGGRSDTVRALARANGMRLMHEYALEHLLQGLATLEEVQRVVPFEEIAAVNCTSCLRELSPSFTFCPYCGEKRMIQEAPSPQTALEVGVIRLALTGAEIRTRCEVRYCLPGIGVGVEFIDISPESVRKIEREVQLCKLPRLRRKAVKFR